jgi:hypothetical protein
MRAIGQLAISNPIQFPDSMRAIQLVGLAKEAELMPSPSYGQRAMTACVFPPSASRSPTIPVQSFRTVWIPTYFGRHRALVKRHPELHPGRHEELTPLVLADVKQAASERALK